MKADFTQGMCVSRLYVHGSEKGNKTPDDMLVNYTCVSVYGALKHKLVKHRQAF